MRFEVLWQYRRAGSDGRESVKRSIVQRVNKQTDYKIVDVYYTEFAVQ